MYIDRLHIHTHFARFGKAQMIECDDEPYSLSHHKCE